MGLIERFKQAYKAFTMKAEQQPDTKNLSELRVIDSERKEDGTVVLTVMGIPKDIPTVSDIIRSVVPSTQDASKPRASGASSVAKIPLANPGLATDWVADTYVAPEYDFAVIDSAYDSEAYVRQGMDKYIDMMFKAGWKITGTDQAAIDYIRLRLQYIAEVTRIPTSKFLMEYAEDVVKYSNAMIIKARIKDQTQIPPGVTVTGLDGKEPIGGYFILNLGSLNIMREFNGTVQSYRQTIPNQSAPLIIPAEDVIHTYYKRRKGAAFGTPFVVPVLDDIRVLRQMEENVSRNVYRNVFPLFHYIVGTPEAPASDGEVEQMMAEVQNMSNEGGIGTSERVKIVPIAADKIVDAEPFMKYHEERVFTGMGVPATMYGRGATSNRATSDNMSKEFIDKCKAFQRVIEGDINEFIIRELLYEGGYDPLTNPDQMVLFQFEEIDIDTSIKMRNQAIFEYEHNASTETEMRTQLGLDPITDADREQMHLAIITLATAAANASPDDTAATDNLVNPQNQNTSGNAQASVSEPNHYTELLHMLRDDIILQLNEYSDTKDNMCLIRIRSILDTMEHNTESITSVHRHIFDTISKYIDRYIDDANIGYDDVIHLFNVLEDMIN